ncbi:MAG: hypothetical protein A3H49_07815 [Nitrospirae bacterium RIFCSPLOWO2_02_FULL_62_14]|nr:MAG: hypothetical protein A3H49_07815 [Nitrospirae bacterium RIFCSPLOWO2_02_FULL_62_14]OGW68413.1 MAG: hypothetical protein A3A88_04175 [Nitrospirae bacterium RIFCSPLOWO2_01_FULL_62_17]
MFDASIIHRFQTSIRIYVPTNDADRSDLRNNLDAKRSFCQIKSKTFVLLKNVLSAESLYFHKLVIVVTTIRTIEMGSSILRVSSSIAMAC